MSLTKFEYWNTNSFSARLAHDPVVVRVHRIVRVVARRPRRTRGAQAGARRLRIAVARVAERYPVSRRRGERHLAREEGFPERDVVDAVLRRKQAERVHDLLRVLLRALVGGEIMRLVRDDRAAEAAAELVAPVVLLVDVVDPLA